VEVLVLPGGAVGGDDDVQAVVVGVEAAAAGGVGVAEDRGVEVEVPVVEDPSRNIFQTR